MNFTWNALKCSLFWPDQLPNNQIQYAINLDKGTKAPKNLIHHRNATRVYALFLILIVHLFPAFTGEWRCLTCLPLESEFLRGPIEKKCHKKGKKSTIFLTPLLPYDDLDFFEFGKNSKFDDPPPLIPNLGKNWNWEKIESGKVLKFRFKIYIYIAIFIWRILYMYVIDWSIKTDYLSIIYVIDGSTCREC